VLRSSVLYKKKEKRKKGKGKGKGKENKKISLTFGKNLKEIITDII
jgi:hypothetical protein